MSGDVGLFSLLGIIPTDSGEIRKDPLLDANGAVVAGDSRSGSKFDGLLHEKIDGVVHVAVERKDVSDFPPQNLRKFRLPLSQLGDDVHGNMVELGAVSVNPVVVDLVLVALKSGIELFLDRLDR